MEEPSPDQSNEPSPRAPENPEPSEKPPQPPAQPDIPILTAPDENRGQTHNIIGARKEKLKRFLLKDYNGIAYLALAVLTWIAVKIRTSNIPGLRDITTGGWTLGPDLDPWLFTRWAQTIIEQGSIPAVDAMRYVPLGYNTANELLLHPYLIAWFHSIASIFGSTSVVQSAAVFPAAMFALTTIAFFFLARKIFVSSLGAKQANLIGIIATFFLITIPSLVPRTIAGIPEKESSGFLFLFLAFYFILCAWQSKSKKPQIIFAVLSGLTTAMMALVWGGWVYIPVTLGLTVIIAFMIGRLTQANMLVYSVWLISSTLIMWPFSTRYSPSSLLASTTTGVAFAAFFLILIHLALFKTNLRQRIPQKMRSWPPALTTLVFTLVLGILLSSIAFGPSFVPSKVEGAFQQLVKPVTDRLGLTVAENRQPFFSEWSGSFGPTFNGIPIFFWLFFAGSVLLFYNLIPQLKKKEKYTLTGAYIFFLIAIIFSRYNGNSTFNGTSTVSLLLYALGLLVLALAVIRVWWRYHKSGDAHIFKKINLSTLFIFSFFFLSIISARGAVRLIMVLVPPAAIMVGYLMVRSATQTTRLPEGTWKKVAWILTALFIIGALFSANYFYNGSKATAQNYVPSSYNQQWQKAMSWVRTNTPEVAVFAHWWDYGYWVQSIGQRATVTDGGNAISYWNHLMGRHALTGPDSATALSFLKTHEVTHFLIDSTDIGKYSAFSTIGSDEDYDRASFIPTFISDPSQKQETKDTTTQLYRGSAGIDEDIIYIADDGQRIFLPAGKAGIGGIILEQNKNGDLIKQPIGVFLYQGQQYSLPLRYAHINGQRRDFGFGIEAGVFVFPQLVNDVQMEPYGALMYLSPRVVNSQLAKLYLYNEPVQGFTLAHTEYDIIVSQIRSQGRAISDFVFFNGVRGPIKIWELNYPAGTPTDPQYLERAFPDERLAQ